MDDTQGQKIEVVGVYKVPWMEAELMEALRQFYCPGNAYVELGSPVAAYIERCVPLVLFEIAVGDVDSRFRVGDFAQEMPGKPKTAAQVAFDEALLSSDGLALIARRQGCADAISAGRIAFYFHYYDPELPMRWTFGEFSCPAVQLVPPSLWKMVPYRPVG
jgi:hypothetical protein